MIKYTLTCENLCAVMGGREIFSGVSFSESGLVGLFGRNGAGKTTLLRTILGFVPSSSGKVILSGDGESELSALSGRERAKYLAYVPQSSERLPRMKVMDFILTGRTPYLGMFDSPKKSDREKAEEAAEFYGISHLAGRYIDEISGGERKSAYLARARTQEAKWLILDEPTAGLDYGKQREFFLSLRASCKNSGTGALVSIHDPHLAAEFCQAVLVIHEGKLRKTDDLRRDVEMIYGLPQGTNKL